MANQSLTDKHQSSGLVPIKFLSSLSFDRYIEHSQKHIEKARPDLDTTNRAKIIAANSPFQWYPETLTQYPKKAILLVHGMLESPFSLWDLGKHFLRRGFFVKSILLPGHGTVPGDLLTMKRNHWKKAVEYGISCCEKEADEIYLLGFSAGACLSLLSAFANPHRFAGLFLFSPMIHLKTNLALFASVFHRLGTVYKPAQWYRLADDLDYAKYESFPYQTIYQAYRLTQEIKKMIKQQTLDLPVFMAFSRDDETIDPFTAEQFFLQQSCSKNRLLIYTNDIEPSFDQRIIYRTSHYPDENILHFSHVSLHVSPDNEHYGKNGDYHPTLEGHTLKYGAKAHHQEDINKDDFPHYYLRRLTYNPDFSFLLKAIDDFIDA